MIKENNCKWNFLEMDDRATYYGPNDAIVQSFNEDFYESLVRESIQNSMDAVYDKSKPVKVKFSFKKLPQLEFPNVFGLGKHIKGCLDTHSANTKAQKQYGPMMSYFAGGVPKDLDLIVVSDSNTTGMEFNPSNPINPFSAFVRSEGLSVKPSTTAGGSFGFGKAAYFLMSPLRAIMVSTRTQAGDSYFEGVSRLCCHNIDGKQYVNIGYYDNQGGRPVSGEDIPDFFRRNEPGTDVMLLGKYEKAGSNAAMEEKILMSVLRNFWLAIYDRRLEVQIGNALVVTKVELLSLMRKYFSLKKTSRDNPLPYYELYTHTETDEYRHYTQVLPKLGEVHLYLHPDMDAKRCLIAQMRDLRMLIGTEKRAGSSMYGLFLCFNDEGNTVLSALEDAAHKSWSSKGKTGDDKKDADETIAILEGFIEECVQDASGLNGDVEYIDVGIGAADNSGDDFLTDHVDKDNPFGIKTGKTVDESDGTSLTTEMGEDGPKQPALAATQGKVGRATLGKMKSPKAVKRVTGTGHGGGKSSSRKGPHKAGTTRQVATPEENAGDEKFTLYEPVSYRAAVQLDGGIWYHNLILDVSDELSKAYIEIQVGGEESAEDAKIVSCSPIGRLGKKPDQKGMVFFDTLPSGKQTIKIAFADNMRHTIKLK